MITLLKREIRCGLHTGGGPFLSVLVFAMVVLMFPLVVGPEAEILKRIGPGLVWMMVVLSSLMTMPAYVAADVEDGSLIQLSLVPFSSGEIFASKALAHMMLTGLPLLILALFVCPLYALEGETVLVLMITLFLGIPPLTLLGLFLGYLSVGAKGGGFLLLILALPLITPLLIFGMGAVDAASLLLQVSSHLSLLGASALILGVIGCWGGAKTLRDALQF